jgi:hypothetical protein
MKRNPRKIKQKKQQNITGDKQNTAKQNFKT